MRTGDPHFNGKRRQLRDSLDYPDDVLAGFDFVVASVHGRFKLDRKTQTERIIRAVENPFTTILGHMTGRQLLRRPASASRGGLGKGALAIGPIIVLPTYIGLSKNQPLTTQRYHANDRVPRKCIHGQEDYRRLAAKERLRLQPVIIRFMYITDRRIALRYIPHYRTNVGRKEAPAVRVYRSDPEGITLEIWREREFMSAWLPFADALAVADAICEAAKEGGAQ